ncbi:MAG: hypothetical protein NPIRA02_23940 [Nitrospirales bacterium]|nr:MAG: hypothetical protein NPIRA02_23940 [Nitrospirales bacterium]
MAMKLYERDYTELTDIEESELHSFREQGAVSSKSSPGLKVCQSLWNCSKAIRHHLSLFPNHYLDIEDLKDNQSLIKQLENFQNLLASTDVTEQSITNFIRQNRAYFIIGSLLKQNFNFGHHDAYLFPEFQLGNSYKADYLLVGKNSGGWEFVFVELEAPIGKITLSDGNLGSSFRKGLAQIETWHTWLQAHYPHLKETFDKCKRRDADLPNEFLCLDISRHHFVVIAGKRKDFTPDTYLVRRRHQQSSKDIRILHYDNLLDASQALIGSNTF